MHRAEGAAPGDAVRRRNPSIRPGNCADMISAVLISDVNERQKLLETRDPLQRLERVIQHVDYLITQLGVDDENTGAVN